MRLLMLVIAAALTTSARAAPDPLQLPVRAAQAAPPTTPPPTGFAPPAAGAPVTATVQAASERPPIPPSLLETTARQIEAQSRGEYGAMERLTQLSGGTASIGGHVPVGTINRQFDRAQIGKGQIQPYVVRFAFDPLLVMQLRTPVHLGTRIFLPEWERVQEPIWNTKPWSFEVARIAPDKLMVIGHAAGDDTMLTVTGGSGNTYTFYVRAEGFNASQPPDAIATIEATSPGPVPIAGMPATALPQRVTAMDRDIVPGRDMFDFNYRWFARTDADREIAPERIFRLGAYTYFDFGARAETMSKPVIYAVLDGVETLVNIETKGDRGQLLRVDRVDVEFALKSGERLVCVKPERNAPRLQETHRPTLLSWLP